MRTLGVKDSRRQGFWGNKAKSLFKLLYIIVPDTKPEVMIILITWDAARQLLVTQVCHAGGAWSHCKQMTSRYSKTQVFTNT